MAIKIFDVSSLFFILVLLSVATECSSVDCCCGTTLFLPAGMIERIFLKRVSAYFAPRDAIGDGMCYLFRLLVIFV